MSVRPMVPADREAIQGIQSLSPETSQWDPMDYTTVVWDEGGGPVAFLVTRELAAGESEILNLAVHPAHRRRGIARALIETLCSDAKRTWYLEVRASNASARKFYILLGFQEIGLRKKYYDDPVEDGIVMRR